MNKEPIKISYSQARYLRFFCQNFIEARQDLYSIVDKVNAFKTKIKRLEKTCKAMEKLLGEKIKQHDKVDLDETSKLR